MLCVSAYVTMSLPISLYVCQMLETTEYELGGGGAFYKREGRMTSSAYIYPIDRNTRKRVRGGRLKRAEY